MSFYLRQLAAVAAFTSFATNVLATSGTGTTTRYWDCCKPSCAWNDLSTLGIDSAVKSCDIHDNILTDTSANSGCGSGGVAYMCSSQSPWAVTDSMAYGFAAVDSSSNECCQCYKLTFTSTAISGKTMIVQATNTGGDVGSTQFDLAMPGGGFGVNDGCTAEWGAISSVWGAQYGGASNNQCLKYPAKLQAGCNFRWDWFKGADNPTVEWETIACPSAITDKSGCVRTGDTPTGSSGSSGSTSSSAGADTPAVASPTAASSNSKPANKDTASTSGSNSKYGQCGGIGWTGSVACSGSTCQKQNDYYSQCL